MKILLLGKSGQVGWELQRILPAIGEVHAADHSQLNLESLDSIRSLIREIQPQVVINAAAYTNVEKAEAESDAAFAINGAAPGVMAEECRKIGAALIHFSTDYVFDGNKSTPYVESDSPNPISVYGQSKFQGEQKIQEAGGTYFILRTSWVYSLRKESFVTKFLSWARQYKEIKIVTDQTGNPTWCRTLAESTAQLTALLKDNSEAWGKEKTGVYHLANCGQVSRYELAKFILANVPKGYPIAAEKILPAKTHEFNDAAKRPAFSALDSAKFMNTFGIQISGWEESLKAALDEFFNAEQLV